MRAAQLIIIIGDYVTLSEFCLLGDLINKVCEQVLASLKPNVMADRNMIGRREKSY